MNKQYKYEMNATEINRLSGIKSKHPGARIIIKHSRKTGIGVNTEVTAKVGLKSYIYDITDYDCW